MASGPSHYAEAERLFAQAINPYENLPYDNDMSSRILAAAQVQATLAHAAATALSEGGMMPGAAADAWAAACATQPIPAAGTTRVWWLDDGQENAGAPELYATHGAAFAAGIAEFRAANPQQFLPSELVWSEFDGPETLELVAAGRRTGIFVRPVQPKGGA